MGTNRISQAEFARKLNITYQALNKAINAGKLRKHGTGRAAYIDLTDALTIEYMESSTPNRRTAKGAKPRAKPKPKPPSKKPSTIAPLPIANAEAVEKNERKQADKDLKIKEELESLRIKNRKARGELIERVVVQAFFHGQHEIDNGQWKTLGLKIATDIAATAKIEDDETIRAICSVVDDEVYKILKQVKRELNKFLKKIGAQKIAKEKAA